MRSYILILSFCLLLPLTGFTQGAIKGMVIDQSNHLPLIRITVQAWIDGKIVQECLTDSLGEFVLPGLGPGNYDLLAKKANYLPQKISGIAVGKDKTTYIDIPITRSIPPKKKGVRLIQEK